MERVRIDWTCPNCEYENRASWSDVDGEVVCQKCKAVSVWRDVLSAAEVCNLIGSMPPKKEKNNDGDIGKRFCPICGGELVWMGELGQKTWYRCKGCGVDVAQEAHEQDNISG